jgi:hypothetical protein
MANIGKGNEMRYFKSPPWHPGVKFANAVLEFMPTDTQETFNNLCQVPEYYDYFKKHGWLEPGAITYQLNNYGFRCEEFDNRDCMIALGCSFTIGIGLPVHNTWPQMVGKELGLVPYTLAWGGTSADTCFRLAEYWIPQLRPKAVFMLTPPPNRFELIKATGYPPVENYMPNSETNNTTEIESFLKHWHTMDENCRLNQKKNKLAIWGMCREFDIPCHIYDAFDHMARSREEVGYARDRMHAGPEGHDRLTKIMLDDFAKK